MPIGMSIKGIQKAQKQNNAMINALRPTNVLGGVIQGITISVQRYAISITHVWRIAGGALRASHRMALKFSASAAEGRVFIDPGSVNPRGQRPAEYGVYEERRGGDHAFYTRTEREVGSRLAKQGADVLRAKIRRPV